MNTENDIPTSVKIQAWEHEVCDLLLAEIINEALLSDALERVRILRAQQAREFEEMNRRFDELAAERKALREAEESESVIHDEP